MPRNTAKSADDAPRAKRTRRITKPTSRKRLSEPRPVSHEQIALRAYELHLLGDGGDPMENWLRAERELVHA